MEHIEIDEYVRTKEGKIDKVINDDYYMSLYIECEKGLTEVTAIKKHSKKIVNLLNSGDILKIDVGFSNILFYISIVNKDELIDGTKKIKKSDIGDFIITDGCFTGCKFTIITKEKLDYIEYGGK